tara:strand:- start:4567 stop:4830 length:264 start_codon:yes stop_codon:yes gene_type:complete
MINLREVTVTIDPEEVDVIVVNELEDHLNELKEDLNARIKTSNLKSGPWYTVRDDTTKSADIAEIMSEIDAFLIVAEYYGSDWSLGS